VPARDAVADIRRLDTLTNGGIALNFYQPAGLPSQRLGFKFYKAGAPVALSDSLPMLEHMGVRVLAEHPYEVRSDQAEPLWIHDFELEVAGGEEIDIEAIAPLAEEAFARVFEGRIENDDFNRLVLRAGLAADEIVVLRAYAKYMRQIGFALSQAFIEATLATHPRIARLLVQLFRLRFDPVQHDRGAAASQVNAIEQALGKGVEPVGRPRAASVPGADHGDLAYQLLAHRRRCERGGRSAPHVPVVQVRSVADSGAARTAADVRDLRLFDAVRRCAPARRQGCARRPALVGPARGFPHRGARGWSRRRW
jgi:hypothetical protein